jgi:hypothetical protein
MLPVCLDLVGLVGVRCATTLTDRSIRIAGRANDRHDSIDAKRTRLRAGDYQLPGMRDESRVDEHLV